jgi:uncharacterized protein
MIKRLTLLALAAFAVSSHAQNSVPIPNVPSASTPAPLPTSPAKKELVQRLLALQRPGIEGIARGLVERPAMQLTQAANRVLQTEIPENRRETVAKEIQGDIDKYVNDTVPLLRDRAVALAPTTIGTAFEERFTEDELRQLLAWLESPVNKKYQQFSPEIQENFVAKLVGDTREVVEPKIKALETSVGKRLGITPGQAPKPATPASGAKKR